MIKSWKAFTEASGTEDLGSLGPASHRTQQPITLDRGDTEVVYTELTGVIYTFDQYDQMYNDYLKIGGSPLFGFNKGNLETVLTELDRNEKS
jgi:hypothetical protein